MAGEGDASAGAAGLEAEYGQFFLSNLRAPRHLTKLEGLPTQDPPAKLPGVVSMAPVASVVHAAPLARPAPLEPVVPIALTAYKGTVATAALAAQRAAAAKAEAHEAQPEEAGLRLGPAPRQAELGVQFLPAAAEPPEEPPESAAAAALPPLPSRSKPEVDTSASRRPESVLGEPRSQPTALDTTQRTPSQSSRPPAGPSRRFKVVLPKRNPGVHFRKSMSLNDRYLDKHAQDGDVVTGRLSPNGQWLKADGHGLYLPMRVGELQILEPVDSGPVEKGRAQQQAPPALDPSLERQFWVRVPKNYPGIQFRRSKDLKDRHEMSAARDERVSGCVEDDGLWLRVHRGGEALFLPITLGGTNVLVPAGDDLRGSVVEKSFQPTWAGVPHQVDVVEPAGGSPGGFAACSCACPSAVDAEVVGESD